MSRRFPTPATLSFVLAAFLANTSYARQIAPPTASPPTAQPASADRLTSWTQDLDFLVAEFPAKHKNPFFKLPKDQWDARVAEIRTKLPTLSDAEIVIEFRKLIALIGDGHSTLWIDRGSTVPAFRQYPFIPIWLADGVFVAALPEQHAQLLGRKLLKLGSLPTDTATARLEPFRAHDNHSGMLNAVMADLRDVESLASLGVIAKDEQLTLTFAGPYGASAGESTITLSPITPENAKSLKFVQKPDPATMPIGRRPQRPVFGHEYLADSKTFYIWYDTCSDQKDKTVAQFIEETITAYDAETTKKPGGVDRVVIDFRRNSGGNSALFTPMIDALARREHLKENGHLFGLIGRRTYSSGMMNAQQLRAATNCLLVGEPTGGTPNGYGEVRSLRLPNSKLNVQYSTKLFTFGDKDADTVHPDILVNPTAAAYFDPRDSILDAAIQYKPK